MPHEPALARIDGDGVPVGHQLPGDIGNVSAHGCRDRRLSLSLLGLEAQLGADRGGYVLEIPLHRHDPSNAPHWDCDCSIEGLLKARPKSFFV